jgi:hypothetical protein
MLYESIDFLVDPHLLIAIYAKSSQNIKLQANNHRLFATNLRKFCDDLLWGELKVLVPTAVLVSVLRSKGHDGVSPISRTLN